MDQPLDRTPPDRSAAWRSWLAFSAILLALWAVVSWVQQPPRPLGLDTPAEQFSEQRAMAVVRKLADEIGPHPVGSAAGAAAAEYLAGELRKLPRLAVELQDAEGDTRLNVWGEVNFHYRVRNVVARLAGRRPDAILINAHYDSPVEANGGADNGIGTAAALEAMRALAASPQLEWSVVLALNGGEEAGSGGAAGFLQHRFAKDVRAFIDTDGSGGGKANLLVASARVPALLRAYARAVRSPQATIFGSDFVQSGLTQVSGDFEPLSRAGLPGLDIGAVQDVWGVHTDLDVSSRLQPGTLQDLGSTILAVTRELARAAPSLQVEPERTVYYDLLGQTTLVYSMRAARWLALGALALLVAVLGLLLRRSEVTGRLLARSAGWILLSALAGLLAALLTALLLAGVLQRPHGFYATPWLIVPCFAVAGLCGVLAVHVWWRRRALAAGVSAETSALAAWAAGLLLWGVLLALGSVASLGIGYLALWWLTPATLALGAGLLLPRQRWGLWLASVAVGASGFIHLAAGLLPAIIGMLVGMNPGPAPGDVPIAVLLWLLIVLPLALSGLAAIHRAGRLPLALAGCSAIAGLGIAATALQAPYSAARPKRLMAVHATREGQTALVLMSQDYPPLAPALAGLPEVQPVPPGEDWPNFLPPGWIPPFSHKLPAQPLPTPPPRLEVQEQSNDAQSGVRTVKLRLYATGWVTFVQIPHQPLAGWSLGGPLPQPLPGQQTISALFVAPDPAGQALTLQLRGPAPVEISVLQFHAPQGSPELAELRRRLPAWTTVNARTLQVARVKL